MYARIWWIDVDKICSKVSHDMEGKARCKRFEDRMDFTSVL